MKTRAQHKGVYLKLNTVTDADVIERLDKQENKQGYLKDLVRTDTSLDSLRNSFGKLTQVKEKKG